MAEQKENSGASFRVIYFGGTGRGEPLRLAAAFGGLAFEDEFITVEQHFKDKAAGKRRWSGTPEIVIYDKDGKEITVIGQSNTCLRYIGQLAGAYPENPIEQALADEVVDSVNDTLDLVVPVRFMKDEEEKKAKEAELCAEGSKLRYWLNKFVLRIQENEKRGNKKGLFVGDRISIADLKFMSIALYIGHSEGLPGGKDLLNEEPYKPLIKLIETVKSNDNIKAFNEQFAKNEAAFKEKPEVNVFKYDGKSVYGSL